MVAIGPGVSEVPGVSYEWRLLRFPMTSLRFATRKRPGGQIIFVYKSTACFDGRDRPRGLRGPGDTPKLGTGACLRQIHPARFYAFNPTSPLGDRWSRKFFSPLPQLLFPFWEGFITVPC